MMMGTKNLSNLDTTAKMEICKCLQQSKPKTPLDCTSRKRTLFRCSSKSLQSWRQFSSYSTIAGIKTCVFVRWGPLAKKNNLLLSRSLQETMVNETETHY